MSIRKSEEFNFNISISRQDHNKVCEIIDSERLALENIDRSSELRCKLAAGTSDGPKYNRMQLMDFKADTEESEQDKTKSDELGRAEDHRRAPSNADGQLEESQQQQPGMPDDVSIAPAPMAPNPLRDSTPPSQILSPLRFQQPPHSAGRRVRRQANRMRHSIDVAHRRFERRLLLSQQQLAQGQTSSSIMSRNSIRGSPFTETSTGNPAVRALFRDRVGQQVRGAVGTLTRSRSANAISSSSGSSSGASDNTSIASLRCGGRDNLHLLATWDVQGTHQFRSHQQAAVVDASRRLIERQIEAIRAADSRRWNFDFSSCQPMNQPNHRYYGHRPQECARGDQAGRDSDVNNNTSEIAIGDETQRGRLQMMEGCQSSENENSNDNDPQQQRQNHPVASSVTSHQSRNFKPLNDQNQNRDA